MRQHVLRLTWIAWIPLLVTCDAQSTPAEVGEADHRDTVTVLTYNIFHDGSSSGKGVPPWAERREAVVDAIRNQAPDVVGLQEAEVWQVSWLLERMPEYAAVGRGPYGDPDVEDAETVAILYLRERFALRESGHFWYSDSPGSAGSYGSSAFGGTTLPRMATWVRLTEPDGSGDVGFYVFNTHFIADAQAADPERARLKSAEVLAQHIAARGLPDAPFVAIGDFNAAPDAAPLQYLLGSLGTDPPPAVRMMDAWSSVHPGDSDTGTRCNAATGDDGPRVDHVLVGLPDTLSCEVGSGSCEVPEVLRADIVDWGPSCPSDHKPVVATVALPTAG